MEPLPDHAADHVGDLVQSGLCDSCLGRLVAKLGYGLTNDQRGRSLRDQPGPDPATCPLCEGLTASADRVADLALRAAEDLDHATFALGCRVDDDLEAREQDLWDDHDLEETAEPIRTQLTREAGKIYEAATDATFDPQGPDLTLIVDTRFWAIETEIAPLYLSGRYLKRARDVPQTRWHCSRCQGSGCLECGGTGKLYADSVEELIGGPALQAFRAGEAILHGQGREDVDVRMLGTGRPFVLELKRPWRRTADLDALAEQIREASGGRVEVRGLAWVTSQAVQEVKETRSRKTYRAEITFTAPVGGEKLKTATHRLQGTISQRTPSRVVHRRADRERKRTVHRFEIQDRSPRRATCVVEGDAGLYIKELVSGDQGRTTPSLSELLGTDARIQELDVIAVEG